MDFDLVLYILVIVVSVAFSVIKSLKENGTVKKNMTADPIDEETVEVVEPVETHQKKAKKKSTPKPKSGEKEYFSYETMSERDFEQAFSDNVEENEHIAASSGTPHSNIHLDMDEEEVYKGIVWAEILNRKY